MTTRDQHVWSDMHWPYSEYTLQKLVTGTDKYLTNTYAATHIAIEHHPRPSSWCWHNLVLTIETRAPIERATLLCKKHMFIVSRFL